MADFPRMGWQVSVAGMAAGALALLREVALLKPDAMLAKPIAATEAWADLCRVCESGNHSRPTPREMR